MVNRPTRIKTNQESQDEQKIVRRASENVDEALLKLFARSCYAINARTLFICMSSRRRRARKTSFLIRRRHDKERLSQISVSLFACYSYGSMTQCRCCIKRRFLQSRQSRGSEKRSDDIVCESLGLFRLYVISRAY